MIKTYAPCTNMKKLDVVVTSGGSDFWIVLQNAVLPLRTSIRFPCAVSSLRRYWFPQPPGYPCVHVDAPAESALSMNTLTRIRSEDERLITSALALIPLGSQEDTDPPSCCRHVFRTSTLP